MPSDATLSEATGYQTFGRKAYWLFLSKWLEVPTAFLIAAVGLSLLGRSSYVPPEYKAYVSWGSLACLAIVIVSALVCAVASRLVFGAQRFALSGDAFKLRQGVLRRHEVAIPYRQIQNVDIERTLYQQILGVSKLVVETAGEDDESTPVREGGAVLQDIDKDLAATLQEELIRRADIQRVTQVARSNA
ncbi:MAG TPA: PH domain-containing protein [Candidatus Paceibacterota bacterium]|nr:PH domain-containing protein [Candidatus Paceibacterota bacterium]